jgi:hypothetical protein
MRQLGDLVAKVSRSAQSQLPGGNVIRTMKTGQCYRCQNPDCRAEIEVRKDSKEGEANPRCCCGTEMKKFYSAPVVKQFGKDAGDLGPTV